MYRQSIPYVLAVALLGFSSSACKKQQIQDEEKPKADATAEPFTWQDALKSTPEQAREALGGFEGCKPAKPIPPAVPETRQQFLSGPGYCKFTAEPERPHDEYKITHILYSENTPVIVRFAPREGAEPPEDVLAAYDLPQPPLERRLQLPTGGNKELVRRILRYPEDERPKDEGAVVGVDVVTEADAPRYVLVFAMDKPGRVVEHLQTPGVPTARPEIVLPTMVALNTPTEKPYAEIRLDDVRVGSFPTTAKATSSGKYKPTSFPRQALSKGTSWHKELGEPFGQAKKEAELLNEEFDPVMVVAADRTVPAHELLGLMKGARDVAKVRRFKLMGRAPEGLDAADPQSGRAGAANLTLLDKRPQPQKTGAQAPLALTVDIQPDGFTVSTPKATLMPIEGCPKKGPTVCRTNAQIDVAEALQEARALQRKGEYLQSQQKVRHVLSSYDWAGLYNVLTKVKRQYPDETVLYVRLEDAQAPVAVVTQLMNTARHKLRVGDSCAEEVSSNEDVLDAEPCEVEDYMQKLFPDTALVDAP